MHAFAELGLNEALVEAVQKMGFEQPSPVQEEAIPLLLSKETDLVALAQTGTGKTAAFGLPLLHKLDPEYASVQALILSPTRELCLQIHSELEKYGSKMKGFKTVAIYGGASIDTQKRQIQKGAQVVVATPGRLIDMIKRKWIRLQDVSWLILDEADEMLNMGFQEDIDRILEEVPEQRNTWLFSATMPKEVARIAKNYMKDPAEIKVAATNVGAKNIEHHAYMLHERDRYPALKRIADFNPDIFGIVFCRTRRETQQIAEKLIEDGYPAAALHGDLSQAQRDSVMQSFRSRSIRMMVATDVAARGIDVDDITHVIHYRLPDDVESYTHRSGRTARAGKSGISLSLVNMKEGGRMKIIERVSQVKFERKQVPLGTEVCERQLLNLVSKVKDIKVEESIKPFIEQVEHELIHLDREELLQHFLSVEFNRFLAYYKNAPDLNASNKSGRDSSDGEGRRGPRTDVKRFFINLGKRDGMEWQDL
ncbi:MAG: ATP-dependent RNA helicase DeaD, partial [Flavobacteriales bacterium]